MKFTVDYEHIFFDRYILSDDEKKNEAMEIVKKVFKDSVRFEENGEIEVFFYDGEEELTMYEHIKMLKREFFILIKPIEVIAPCEKEEDAIDKAEKYIRKRYLDEALCASEVCEYSGINRKSLDNAFKERYSKSVSEYIKYMRVEKTKEHIAAGEKLEIVASVCGFGSLKTMQRAFKSVCGKTPAKYRTSRLDSRKTK